MTEANNNAEYAKAKKQIATLFETIKDKDLNKIKEVLSETAKAHKVENENEDDATLVKSVLNDTREGKGRTLFHFACSRGDIEIVKYLVSQGADISVADEDGSTGLFAAIHHKNYDLAKWLIEEQKFDVNAQRKGNVTILHVLASEGDIKFIDYVLSKGANIDGASNYGSPLEWALSSGRKEIVLHLLEKGASPNGQPHAEKIVPPPLIMAINFQDKELLKNFLDKKADVHQKDPEGYDGLQFAAELGLLDICQTLIAAGADPNYICKGKSALDLAYEGSQWECVSYLRPLTTKKIEEKSEKVEHKTQEEEDLLGDQEEPNAEEADKLKGEGNALFQKENYKDALEVYRKALKYNRKLVAIYTNIGLCLIKLGDPKLCLRYCEKAKKLDPTWTKAFVREGQAYHALKEYGEAAASYWEAMNLDPKNEDIRDMFNEEVRIGKKAYQQQQNK